MSDIPPFQRRKSRSGTRSMSEKTDMPRYKFHANVEASIPSAPGTQLMSRTNYEAVADFAGHWLHRAQASLLTGATGQIKLRHPKKTLVRAWRGPGAGLVRAWCGPGAGLVRAWRGPGAGLVRVPRPKPRSRPRFAEPSNGRSSD